MLPAVMYHKFEQNQVPVEALFNYTHEGRSTQDTQNTEHFDQLIKNLYNEPKNSKQKHAFGLAIKIIWTEYL